MVGRNVVDFLREHSNVRLHTPSSRELDLLNRSQVRDYLRRVNPDLIIHAAGLVGGIAANVARPVRFLVDNALMGFVLIEEASNVGIPRIMNLGSSCMYPRSAPNPLREDVLLSGELEPTNEGYALAKICVAKLCMYITLESAELNYKTIIPCNLYGKYDHFDVAAGHMVPAALYKIHYATVSHEQEVTIWGDGTTRREFLFASDLADFVSRFVWEFDRLPPVMNVGVGVDHSIIDYYRTISDVVGFAGAYRYDLDKPIGMQKKVLDVSKQVDLGWRPTTSLRDGITRTYEHFLATLS